MGKQVIVIVIIVSLLIGFGVGFYQGKQSATNRFQAQIEKAKKFFPEALEIFSISGAIKKIDGNVLTIETPESANPFEDFPTMREVIVNDDTEIIKREQKSPEVFNREIAAYEQALNRVQRQLDPSVPAPTDFPMSPDPFKETKIALDGLEVNNQILVDAGGENIKDSARFGAVRVVVLEADAAVLPESSPAPAPLP